MVSEDETHVFMFVKQAGLSHPTYFFNPEKTKFMKMSWKQTDKKQYLGWRGLDEGGDKGDKPSAEIS